MSKIVEIISTVMVKSAMARSLAVENQSPTTECGVDYQLLAVIY